MDKRFVRNVLLKALALFVTFNLLWMAVNLDFVGSLSLYNRLWRGRERLPYGENSAESYNLSLYNLTAMMESHAVDADKPKDEFRIFIIGDSSTWGTLLTPDQTLAGQLNALGLTTADGRKVRVYNLGYPTLSLTKDLMILDHAIAEEYAPDLVLWPVTLESFPRNRQLDSPIAANNLALIASLQQEYGLNLDVPADTRSPIEKAFSRTIIGERRPLADLARLQMYGILWSATGIDQAYPADYTPAARDLPADATFNGWQGPALDAGELSLDVLEAGVKAAGNVPVVIINEPILVSSGQNSDVRYDFYYPRWAYDDYREILSTEAAKQGWNYVDLWNAVGEEHYTNSAIHLDREGVRIEMENLLRVVQVWLR